MKIKYKSLTCTGLTMIFVFWVCMVDAAKITGQGGKCLDVEDANSSDGTPAILWPCHGGKNQQWRSTIKSTIVGLGGKCLDVSDADPTDGTPVILWSCHGGENQQWFIRPTGEIVGLGGKCLDVEGGLGEDGARIILWPCSGAENQKWDVLEAWKEMARVLGSGGTTRPPLSSIHACLKIGNIEGDRPFKCVGEGGGKAGFWGRKPAILVRFRSLESGLHTIEARYSESAGVPQRDLSGLNQSYSFQNDKPAWAYQFPASAQVGDACQECRITIVLDGTEVGSITYSGSVD